jgi:hypothetical protein
MVRLRASLPLLSGCSVVAVGRVLLVLGLAAFAQTGPSCFPAAAWLCAYGHTAAGNRSLMPVPGAQQVGERPLEELGHTVSQQAGVLLREQVEVARRELTARARQAGPGVAMVGGGAVLAALASGTGTAALILLLARRPGASAAALGVTGAYAAAGALLTREGLVRLREAVPSVPDVPVQDESGQNAKQDRGSAKRRTTSAAKSPRRTKSAAKSSARPTRRAKPKSAESRRRTSPT